MISSSVCAFWVEIATTGRVCVSRQRSKALFGLLPQPKKVSIRAGCLPVSSVNRLNCSVEPRSETPSRTSGFGGTSDIAAPAGAAKTREASRTRTARARRLRGGENIPHPSRLDPEGLRVGDTSVSRHRNLHQLGLLPSCKHGLAEDDAEGAETGADQRQRHVDEIPRAPGDAADQVRHLVVGER